MPTRGQGENQNFPPGKGGLIGGKNFDRLSRWLEKLILGFSVGFDGNPFPIHDGNIRHDRAARLLSR